MKALLASFLLSTAALAAPAADLPYDEHADAKAAIQQALAHSAGSGQAVLVVFGANWCPDCRVLDQALKQGPSAPLVATEFQMVKVDVGRFDRNVEVAEAYGVNLKKGIPTVAILSARGEVLHVTKDGELADARHMGDDGIFAFFQKLTGKATTK